MPELPEVELVRLQLNKFIVGHRIKNIIVNWKNSFRGEKNKVIGAKIIKVERMGKVIIIKLDNNKALLMHLKMTGQPIYRGPNLKGKLHLSEKVLGGVPGKHTQVQLDLDKRGVLYFNDVRKFGWIKVVDKNSLMSDPSLKSLGLEPGKDLRLSDFNNLIDKSTQKIKLLIMDQKKISGVGNIYANEALFLAGIKPDRKSSSLSAGLTKKLFNAINKVLKEGVDKGGSSDERYVKPDGTEGSYQKHALIYGREGKPCRLCKTPIEKMKLGGRGTYWCPSCQK